MDHLVVSNAKKIGCQTFEISSGEALMTLEHRKLLVKALDLEIIYDQVIEAYWEYKSKLNYWNLRVVSSPFADYVLNHEVRSSLNRLAFNLFNLSKLYLDWHYNERKKRCFSFELTNEESSKDKIIAHRSEIYDTNLHYVVGCNLRGYNQHSKLPIRSFTQGIRYVQGTSNKIAHFSIYYNYDDLEQAGIPKDRISRDIKLDLTNIIDGFVYAISQKHMLNRELTEVVVNKARSSIISMCKSYAAKAGFENYRCELLLNGDKRVGLSLEWFDVFEYLNEKHRNNIDYSNITFER